MARKEKEVVYSSEDHYTKDGERIVYRDREPQKKKRNPLMLGCLGLIMLAIIIGACSVMTMGGEDDNKDDSKDTTTSDKKSDDKKDSKKTLSVGDSKKMDDITYTLNDASFTDERNEFNDVKADKVLTIKYTVKNDSKDDYPLGTDAAVYVDGKQAKEYPLGSDEMGAVSSGREGTASQSFAIVGDGKIEVEFEPVASFSGDKAVYSVDPK